MTGGGKECGILNLPFRGEAVSISAKSGRDILPSVN
jgi:hypothetical protein